MASSHFLGRHDNTPNILMHNLNQPLLPSVLPASFTPVNFRQPSHLQLQCQMAFTKGLAVFARLWGLGPFCRTTGIFAGKSNNTFHPAAVGPLSTHSLRMGCSTDSRRQIEIQPRPMGKAPVFLSTYLFI